MRRIVSTPKDISAQERTREACPSMSIQANLHRPFGPPGLEGLFLSTGGPDPAAKTATAHGFSSRAFKAGAGRR